MDSTPNRPIPQIAHLLVPEPLVRERVSRDMLATSNDRDTHLKLMNASGEVYNAGYHDYFTLSQGSGIATQYGEDYVELYQIYRREDNPLAPLWGSRLYRSGAVTRRSIVVSYPRSGELWLQWFIEELRATMVFADQTYKAFGVSSDEIRIVSVLRGCENVPLMVPGLFAVPVKEQPKIMDHLTLLPTREPIRIRRGEMRDDLAGIANEMGRLLRLRYEKSAAAL